MKKLLISLFTLSLIIAININSQSQILDSPPQDGLFPDIGMIDKKPVPYPPLRKADIMWSKRIWRVIDMREKINQPFYYPLEPHHGWRSFMQIIMDALKEGSITAYDISGTDEFLVPLTYQAVITSQIDTFHTILNRPYPPYDEYDTVIYSEFDPSKVMRLRIKEDWYFDKQRSQLLVRILGICPVMMKEREGVEIPEPLFWIYFPEARPILAKAEMFNRFNSAERRTYDEIFWKRMFGSYVYKEQNVYDRKISQYATGMDALFEAERIKNELFEFEHDLWEF
ncbi:MAG: gliding motility protein GldN [Bacteroidetes bacterium]|nr:gliding motility protein GldN [Bacteroidota bacterium]MCK4287660.1 gliding motility protein GldN [Bacteroidales bacterium]MCK4360381.1 gliding motility protein GldN [Bacteroidales bacterium]MCK4406208.1 gliding motility protein GldN [Bacteroidales bacterium]